MLTAVPPPLCLLHSLLLAQEQLRRGACALGQLATRPPLWPFRSWHVVKVLDGHRGNPVYCVGFDKSGTRIVSGGDDGIVKLWAADTGFLVRACRGHSGHVTELAIRCAQQQQQQQQWGCLLSLT